ncbi:MAG TPA: DUF5666 domain-containing protein [Steroidobacteraceae bacterium]|nr:DUF5666 domain-containing protein [Steroidobacteraceae bacterium]
MRRSPRWRAWIAGVATAVCAAALSGCGSGSGVVAGIEGTGTQVAAVSSGPISRFGSIFVNGVEYGTTGAGAQINGQTAAVSALSVGDVVVVHGSIDANGTSGIATEVDYDTNVQGPIDTVDAAASSFTVLGQTVLVGPQTSLAADAGGTPAFAALVPGALVEVSGFASANGEIAATRVELRTQVASYLVTGVVSSIDPTTLQLALNGATIDFSGAAFAGFAAGATLQAGEQIQVESPPTPVAGTFGASQITLLAAVAGAAGAEGEIDGAIAQFTSPADFDVDATHVATGAQTQFQNGGAAQLAVGVQVSVQGSFNGSGTLQASAVQFSHANPVRVKAPVDAVDPVAGTLTMLGIQITTDAETRYEDQSTNPVSPFNFSALAVGDYVEIHGRLISGNVVVASVLTREATSGEVELRAVPSAIAAPSLTVLGIDALTGAATQFAGAGESPITSAQFFSAATTGATVDLSGTVANGVLQVATANLPGEAELGD